jgi:cell wall-associated NlpC family hydrolase
MSRPLLDKRIHAYRDDLAASQLKGQIDVPRYSDGEKRQVITGSVQLRKAPRFDAPMETEFLFGETVVVYDENEGWAWVQGDGDAYVGYMSADALKADISQPTHHVRALRTHLYSEPDIKVPVVDLLSMNSQLVVESIDGRFARLADGRFAIAAHLSPIDEVAKDFVSVAQEFLGSPYLWGGRSSIGLDCSALIQLALQATGISVPRDTDLQEGTIGSALPDPHDQSSYTRRDLLFWNGHVGVMLDENRLLHANAHHMAVAIEPVAEAVTRIEASESLVTSVRRGAGEA